MRQILLVIIVSFWSASIFAQNQNLGKAKLTFPNKISIGVNFGYAPITYHNGIGKFLKKNEFSSIRKSVDNELSFLGTESSDNLKLYFDISYSLKSNRDVGVLIDYNFSKRGYVIGSIPDFSTNHPDILPDLEIYSSSTFKYNGLIPYFRFTTLNRKVQLDLGISANRIEFDIAPYIFGDNFTSYFPDKQIIPFKTYLGAMIGGSYAFVEREYFYSRISGRFDMLVTPMKIEAMDVSVENLTTQESENITIISEQNLWLQKLIFSISLGWKF